MPTPKTILTAAFVAPMASAHLPLLRDAGVVFAGDRILAVGPVAELRRAHPDAALHHAGSAVILPGLVNAHVHLELSDAAPAQPPPASFADWLLTMVRRGGMRTPEQIAAATAAGIAQCLRFGVTSVGDITRFAAITRPILARSPLHGVSYGEVAAMAQRRGQLEPLLKVAVSESANFSEGADAVSEVLPRPGYPVHQSTSDPASATPSNVGTGISPHAPYSIEPAGYRRCLDVARQHNLPLATHLAESADESQFLADHTGPLRQLWTLMNAWDDQVPRFAGGPIRYAQSLGLLQKPTLLAHVNYCDDAELAILAAGRASVVYCPRTHAYFRHPPHRWRDMLAAGINVAIGTDSCASSADLNLVEDLRLLHQLAPDVSAHALWQMATIRAAHAIAKESVVGSLQAGKRADMVIFSVCGDDPLKEVLEAHSRPHELLIGGVRV